MTKSDYVNFYQQDCLTLVELFNNKLGIEITEKQAYKFWKWHSESYCAGWLSFGSFIENEEDLHCLKFEYDSFLDYQKEAMDWGDE
jgi:hypothetical protein